MTKTTILATLCIQTIDAVYLGADADSHSAQEYGPENPNPNLFTPWWETRDDEWEGGPGMDDPDGSGRWIQQFTDPSEIGYFATNDYESQTASKKLDDLWTQIEPEDMQTPAPLLWNEIDNLFMENMNGPFCIFADEMELYRKKVTHINGVVAKVKWEPVGDHQYTGIYKTGSENILLRFSQTSNLNESSTGLHPSLALKFLIDGRESANIMAMPNFTGSDSWDFFHEHMRNRVEPFAEGSIEAQTIQRKLIEGSANPFMASVGEIAKFNNDGTDLGFAAAHTPYELEFRSNYHFDDDKEFDASGDQVPFYDQLKSIPNGSSIMEVWGMNKPAALGGEYEHIANVKLLTSMYTSEFGDTRLHFNHRRLSMDARIWPIEWKNLGEDLFFDQFDHDVRWGNDVPTGEGLGWPEDMDEAEAKYVDQVAQYGCPFAWLLGMN